MQQLNHNLSPELSSRNLYLRLHADGYSYLVVRAHDNSVEYYQQENFENSPLPYAEALENAVYADELLLGEYHKTTILFSNNRYTFVPAEIFSDKTTQSQAYDFCYHDHQDEVLCDSVVNGEIACVYGVKKQIYDFLSRTFATSSFTHSLSQVCRFFYNKPFKNSRVRMYAMIHDQTIDIVCVDRHSLLLVNTFTHRQESDIPYCLLNVWQQLELDANSDELRLISSLPLRRHIIATCKSYISNIVPFIYPAQMNEMGVEPEQIPFDLILTPLIDKLCE